MSVSQTVAGAWHFFVRGSQISGKLHITQVTSPDIGHSLGSSAHWMFDSQRPSATLQNKPGPHSEEFVHCTQRPSGSQLSPTRQAGISPARTHSLVSIAHWSLPSQVEVAKQETHSMETERQT